MFKDMPVQLAGMVNLHHKNVSVFNNNSRSCKERTQHLAAGNFEQPNGSMLPICLKWYVITCYPTLIVFISRRFCEELTLRSDAGWELPLLTRGGSTSHQNACKWTNHAPAERIQYNVYIYINTSTWSIPILSEGIPHGVFFAPSWPPPQDQHATVKFPLST